MKKTEVNKFRWTVSSIWSHEFRITIGVWCYLPEYLPVPCCTPGTDLTSSHLPVFEVRTIFYLCLNLASIWLAGGVGGGGFLGL